MYKRITLFGDLNVDYMWVRSKEDATISPNINKPVWDGETIALANFKQDSAASSYEGGDYVFDKYKVYRWDKNTDRLKYIATISNDKLSIKDYTNGSNNESKYYIYPINEDNTGAVIETLEITPKYNCWTISSICKTKEDNVYCIEDSSTWRFWLSPEISSFSQVTNKSVKTGYKRFPKIKYSDVNYTTGNMKFYIGDLSCAGAEYIEDSVYKKNLWIEFANSHTPKLLTDPKGECMIVDITPTETQVDYNLVEMPTTISFDFTQIDSIDNISVYSEVKE